MATKSILKHGFKAKAERLALEYRKQLDLSDFSPLCAFKLAEHLSIPVYKATDFITLPSEIASLKANDGHDCGWSALTMKTNSGNTIIINNPYHSIPRQQSDLMHELAHIICEHSFESLELEFPIPMGMRSFNELHEEEAKCVGSSLQITRSGLLWGLKKNLNNDQLADHFNASVDMVKYRLRMTGVAKQLSYSYNVR